MVAVAPGSGRSTLPWVGPHHPVPGLTGLAASPPTRPPSCLCPGPEGPTTDDHTLGVSHTELPSPGCWRPEVHPGGPEPRALQRLQGTVLPASPGSGGPRRSWAGGHVTAICLSPPLRLSDGHQCLHLGPTQRTQDDRILRSLMTSEKTLFQTGSHPQVPGLGVGHIGATIQPTAASKDQLCQVGAWAQPVGGHTADRAFELCL